MHACAHARTALSGFPALFTKHSIRQQSAASGLNKPTLASTPAEHEEAGAALPRRRLRQQQHSIRVVRGHHLWEGGEIGEEASLIGEQQHSVGVVGGNHLRMKGGDT